VLPQERLLRHLRPDLRAGVQASPGVLQASPGVLRAQAGVLQASPGVLQADDVLRWLRHVQLRLPWPRPARTAEGSLQEEGLL
jgi:hypothetical protein